MAVDEHADNRGHDDHGRDEIDSHALTEEYVLPVWVESRLVPDADFAKDYHDTPPSRRALLKQAIARLHILLGERRHVASTSARAYGDGFQIMEEQALVQLVAVVVDEPNPAELLAAVLPAQLAGVPRILVIKRKDKKQRRPWPPGVLAALEIAGVELALEATDREVAALLRHAEDHGQGVGLVSIMSDVSWSLAPHAMTMLQGVDLHVWREGLDKTALEDLRWAHGGVRPITLWGPGGAAPQGFLAGEDDAEAFGAQPATVKFLPPELLELAHGSAPVLLASSFLGLWIWPGLTPDSFFEPRLSCLV